MKNAFIVFISIKVLYDEQCSYVTVSNLICLKK